MSKDAIVAWLYIRETSQVCMFDASKDRDFVRFLADMAEHYWCEFEAMDNVTHVLRWLEEEKKND